ncbi:hypothetical protein ACJX0J_008332 [Zea mays]
MKFEFSHIFFPYQIAFMWDFRIWISGLLLCLETTLETWSIIIKNVCMGWSVRPSDCDLFGHHIFFPYQITFMWDFRIWISGLLLCLETTLETWSIIIKNVYNWSNIGTLLWMISGCTGLNFSNLAPLWSCMGWSVRPSEAVKHYIPLE